jgi:hypothetical protein
MAQNRAKRLLFHKLFWRHISVFGESAALRTAAGPAVQRPLKGGFAVAFGDGLRPPLTDRRPPG